MRITGTRQGALTTNLPGIAEYQSFRPSRLDDVLPLSLDSQTTATLALCARRIGEMEGMSRFIPNADMYLTMYVRKEALLSSQIEGTQCTFDDVLDPAAKDAWSKDVDEVVNYVRAAELAVKEMDEMPLCVRLLRMAHRELLAAGRGAERQPGEIRDSQNWIGPAGCTIQNAAFVPPNVDDMREALADLERFIHREDVDPVIKAALVHYQFETIHPFLDGNGRLGRLLVTLSLMNDGVLTRPIFYPSYQLKLNRTEYYRRLTLVREQGDYEGWVKFFCTCLAESARDAAQSLQALVELHAHSEELIEKNLVRGAANGHALLRLLEAHPIVTTAMVCDELGVSRTTAANLIDEFRSLDLLRETDAQRKRYRTFCYEPYLEILRTGSDPL